MDVTKAGFTLPQVPTLERSNDKSPTPVKAFGEVLQQSLESTVQAQKTAEALSVAVAQGEDIPMNKVVEAVSAAEIKLQTLVTVRDRAVQAYQQITQMPI